MAPATRRRIFRRTAAQLFFDQTGMAEPSIRIPALGGEARLLARDGLNPRFSPDGSQVAYWIGAKNVSASVPGSGTIWLAPASGGKPRRVAVSFTAARYPIWSADGKRLLFVGYTSPRANETSSFDWWVLAPNGGEPVKTGALRFDGRQQNAWQGVWDGGNTHYRNPPQATVLVGSPTLLAFDAVSDEASNLWELGISPQTGKVSGAIRKLTTGAGSELDPS